MAATKLVCMVFAAVGLAGCGTTGPVVMGGGSAGAGTFVTTKEDCPDPIFIKGETNGCSNSVCANPVIVVWDGKACQVMVGAQTIKMSKGNNDAQLRWWLPESSKWEFREESSLFALPIKFANQEAPGLREQFSNRNVPNRKAVHIKNKNSNKEKYEYQIRVFKKDGGPNDYIDSTDPAIQNDP